MWASARTIGRMVGLARTATLARVAAILVAVMLSGAPHVVAMHAPAEGHRCACKAHAGGDHECECAICRRAALEARSSDEKLPPCHRAAARNALAKSNSGGIRDGSQCIEGPCGSGSRPPVTISGIEPFCLPVSSLRALSPPQEARPAFTPRLQHRSPDPETPPPRAA